MGALSSRTTTSIFDDSVSWLMARYVWVKLRSEWIPKEEVQPPYRLRGVPSTPLTRVIPDEELPYFDQTSANKDSADSYEPSDDPVLTAPVPATLIDDPSSTADTVPPFPIEIEELPADSIDSPTSRSEGNLFSTLWEYLTLFWRK